MNLSRREALFGVAAVSALGTEELSADDLEVLRAAELLEHAHERDGTEGKSWPKGSGMADRIKSLASRGYFAENPRIKAWGPLDRSEYGVWYLLTAKGRRALAEAR